MPEPHPTAYPREEAPRRLEQVLREIEAGAGVESLGALLELGNGRDLYGLEALADKPWMVSLRELDVRDTVCGSLGWERAWPALLARPVQRLGISLGFGSALMLIRGPSGRYQRGRLRVPPHAP